MLCTVVLWPPLNVVLAASCLAFFGLPLFVPLVLTVNHICLSPSREPYFAFQEARRHFTMME